MSRTKIILLSLLAVFAVSAVASASASASTPGCYRVAVAGTGHWENNACTVAGGTKEYVKATTPITQIKPGEWCAKAEAGEPSTYEDEKCTKAKTGTGEFIKVKAVCYPVAEPETGRFATSATCEARTPVIAKGAWVNISKLENEVEPGVWCATVETAKTGNYKNNKCTEKLAEGEFIKVKVSVDEWEVQKCEEGTATIKFTTNSCETESTTGKFTETGALEKLAASKKRKVTSSGGEFKLKAGTLTITCKKVTDKGTITGGKPGTDLAEEIKFTECTTGQAGCKVRSSDKPAFGTINTTNIPTKLEQRLVGEEEILVDNFEQKEVSPGKFEFVTLQFEAEAGKSGTPLRLGVN
jgi:hypothetical protein